ncbi:Retrovirus-related Pol poly from transposon [Biomphalaria glabrata]|nr:Retrovirus-related Pol poly from transposon [Biomphalaria glabrata]
MLPLWQPKSFCQGLPKKRQPTVVTSRATEGLTKDSVLNKIAGTCPTVEVLIEGVPLLAMVDTGSQVSTITESFFFRHFQGSVKALQPADIRLTAANGLLIPFVGYFVATISVGDQVLADKAFLVLRDSGSSTQCILGMNVLQDIIGISALIKPGFEQENNSGQARTTRRPIVVPAWSIQLITATGSNPRLNAELLFEPLETPFHPNLLMVPALTTTEKGHFQLAAVNLSNESVTIRPRTHIGSIHPATLQTGKVEVRLDTISAEIIAYNPLKATPLKGSHIDFSSMISEALASEERSAMSSLLHSFSDVFAWSDDDLGFTNVIEHKIPLIDETPQAQPYRRLPPSEFQAVKEHIEKLASKATSSAGEYLQQHLTRLRALHEHATRVNREVAAQRDNRVASFPTTRVVIGDLVVLRQHVAGRNKIADRYGSVVYTVLAVPPESGGYFTVQTLDKQITRRVSGTQLKLYVPQAEAIQPPPKPQEIHYERPSSPGVTYSVYRIPLPGATSQPESTPAPAPVGPRRSSRTRRPPTRLDL